MAHSDALTQAAAHIDFLLRQQGRAIVAIDGRCAAGKTTLARQLAQRFTCTVLHMDDFFLQPHQRTEARLQQAGGNVDYERFLTEVLLPLKEGNPFAYRPYDCHTQSLLPPVAVSPTPLTIVEGSYSCHEALWAHYDLRIFLDVDESVQRARIVRRNGVEGAARFAALWIPLEEAYFAARELRSRCELCLRSDEQG